MMKLEACIVRASRRKSCVGKVESLLISMKNCTSASRCWHIRLIATHDSRIHSTSSGDILCRSVCLCISF